MLVYFLMLKPAMIVSFLLVGVPVLLVVWLFPYLSAYMRRKRPAMAGVHHAGARRMVRDRPQ